MKRKTRDVQKSGFNTSHQVVNKYIFHILLLSFLCADVSSGVMQLENWGQFREAEI